MSDNHLNLSGVRGVGEFYQAIRPILLSTNAMSGTLFSLDEGYYFGIQQFYRVMESMRDGKPIMCEPDAGLLSQMVCLCKQGDHLEIGSAYGGSMLIAIRALDHVGRTNDKVVCIEPFGEEKRDTLHKAVEKEFWRNVDYFGVRDRIEHVKAFSHPLPIHGRRFSTAFIDGDHSYEYVLNDWNNLKGIVDNYIMFHDYARETVRRVVLEHAIRDKDWTLVAVHGWSAVMRRNR